MVLVPAPPGNPLKAAEVASLRSDNWSTVFPILQSLDSSNPGGNKGFKGKKQPFLTPLALHVSF